MAGLKCCFALLRDRRTGRYAVRRMPALRARPHQPMIWCDEQGRMHEGELVQQFACGSWAQRVANRLNRWLVGLLLLAGPALAGDFVTLAWDPNSEPDLGGYIVYYGPQSRVYTNAVNVGNVTLFTVTGLVWNARYYFAVTAYNTNGLESDFSDEVVYTSSPPVRVRLLALTRTNVTLTVSNAQSLKGFVRLRRQAETNWTLQLPWAGQPVVAPLTATSVWVVDAWLTNSYGALQSEPLPFSNMPPAQPRQLRILLRLQACSSLPGSWKDLAVLELPVEAEGQRFYRAFLELCQN